MRGEHQQDVIEAVGYEENIHPGEKAPPQQQDLDIKHIEEEIKTCSRHILASGTSDQPPVFGMKTIIETNK